MNVISILPFFVVLFTGGRSNYEPSRVTYVEGYCPAIDHRQYAMGLKCIDEREIYNSSSVDSKCRLGECPNVKKASAKTSTLDRIITELELSPLIHTFSKFQDTIQILENLPAGGVGDTVKYGIKSTAKNDPMKDVIKYGIKRFAEKDTIGGILNYAIKSITEKDPIGDILKEGIKSVAKNDPIEDVIKYGIKSIAKNDPIEDVIKYVIKRFAEQDTIGDILSGGIKNAAKNDPIEDTRKYDTERFAKKDPFEDAVNFGIKSFAKKDPGIEAIRVLKDMVHSSIGNLTFSKDSNIGDSITTIKNLLELF